MIRIVKMELKKLKRSSILMVGIFAMFLCVMLTRFMATASNAEAYTFVSFSNSVIWNNFSLVFPTLIFVIVENMIEKEYLNDTMKNICVIPISIRRLLIAKVFAVAIICVGLGGVEFIFTLFISIISRYPMEKSCSILIILAKMVMMDIYVYIAILPIFLLFIKKRKKFINGVVFSFFYGLLGIVAANHGFANIYPITVGLGLIYYQGEYVMEYDIKTELIVIFIILILSYSIILTISNKDLNQ